MTIRKNPADKTNWKLVIGGHQRRLVQPEMSFTLNLGNKARNVSFVVIHPSGGKKTCETYTFAPGRDYAVDIVDVNGTATLHPSWEAAVAHAAPALVGITHDKLRAELRKLRANQNQVMKELKTILEKLEKALPGK